MQAENGYWVILLSWSIPLLYLLTPTFEFSLPSISSPLSTTRPRPFDRSQTGQEPHSEGESTNPRTSRCARDAT